MFFEGNLAIDIEEHEPRRDIPDKRKFQDRAEYDIRKNRRKTDFVLSSTTATVATVLSLVVLTLTFVFAASLNTSFFVNFDKIGSHSSESQC